MGRIPTGEPVGRPQKEINWETFEELCTIQCTQDEIINILKISDETLRNHCREHYGTDFLTAYKRFADNGKMSLRRTQHKVALEGNTTMLVWLGKNRLGQRDQPIEDQHEKLAGLIGDFNDNMKRIYNLPPREGVSSE